MNSIAKNDKLPKGFKDDTPIILHPSKVLSIGSGLYNIEQEEHFADCIAMYIFLYQTVRHQGNVQVWTNQKFLTKGLHWGHRKVARTLGLLEAIGFIEFVGSGNDKTFRGKTYIKVNYIWSPEKFELMEIEASMKTIEGIGDTNRDDIIRVNLLKDILIRNFGRNGEIETDATFDFPEVINGVTDLKAFKFTFEGDNNLLIAHGEEVDFYYTVPLHYLEEVLKFIIDDRL